MRMQLNEMSRNNCAVSPSLCSIPSLVSLATSEAASAVSRCYKGLHYRQFRRGAQRGSHQVTAAITREFGAY